jgi:hypothetical protein
MSRSSKLILFFKFPQQNTDYIRKSLKNQFPQKNVHFFTSAIKVIPKHSPKYLDTIGK